MDLFDDENGNNSAPVVISGEAAVVTLPSNAIKVPDVHEEVAVVRSIKDLDRVMSISIDLCEAAFTLGDFVPGSLQSSKEKEAFWVGQIIPNIAKTLQEDLTVRYEITLSLRYDFILQLELIYPSLISAIRELAHTIRDAALGVFECKGSPDSIEIAKQSINEAFTTLQECEAKAKNFTFSAISMYREHAEAILKIIGPTAAQYSNQRAVIFAEIESYDRQIHKILDKKAELEGEVIKSSSLMHYASERLMGKEKALTETRVRMKRLTEMIELADEKIDAISEPIDNEGSILWGLVSWKKRHSPIKNEDKEAQRAYYESIIRAREARKRAEMDYEGEVDANKKQLEEEVAGYQKALVSAMERLDTHNRNNLDLLKNLQREIDRCNRRLEEIDKESAEVESTIGLHGRLLVRFLAMLRHLNANQQAGSTMLFPLVSLLAEVRALVAIGVRYLGCVNKNSVYVGGKNLIEKVGYIRALADRVDSCLGQTDERRKMLQNRFKESSTPMLTLQGEDREKEMEF